MRRLIRTCRVATSRLSEVEVSSALARRAREGAFTLAERDRAIDALNADLASWILVEVGPELTRRAQALLVRHGIRTGDAVQLASCLHLQREAGQRLPFGAFDERLNAAAGAEGLSLISFP